MKITDACENDCGFCYEASFPQGKHGSLDYEFLKTIPHFTEIAVGGGNPLLHPELEKIAVLTDIVNITVHEKAFLREFQSEENRRSALNLFHSVGISCTDREASFELIRQLLQYNRDEYGPENQGENGYVNDLEAIFGKDYEDEYYSSADVPYGGITWGGRANHTLHLVNGIVTKELMESLYNQRLKILILGYKEKGRGAAYMERCGKKLQENQAWLYDHIEEVMKKFKVVSFDNLAIRQLGIKRFFSDEEWDMLYMGEDGEHSMYIDLVKGEFGISSTDSRRWLVTSDIREMFRTVRENAAKP